MSTHGQKIKKSKEDVKKLISDTKSHAKKEKSSTVEKSPKPTKVSKVSDIDSLFASAKEKKIDKRRKEADDDVTTKKKVRVEPEVDDKPFGYGIMQSSYNHVKIVNPEAPLERIDKDSGLPVYKAHLLKVGEGGGTPLCPFDCNCCF